tara:strand:- start:1309 stop:1605 length:297 start_codon:yes stop_codon:yes gene_type:complete
VKSLLKPDKGEWCITALPIHKEIQTMNTYNKHTSIQLTIPLRNINKFIDMEFLGYDLKDSEYADTHDASLEFMIEFSRQVSEKLQALEQPLEIKKMDY